MASFIYNSLWQDVLSARIDFYSADFRVALMSSGYAPDQSNDARFADILANEASGPGYEEGGELVDVAVAVGDGFAFTLAGHVWPQATVRARYAVYYRDAGELLEDSELIACIDFGMDVSSTNAKFELTASTLRTHT